MNERTLVLEAVTCLKYKCLKMQKYVISMSLLKAVSKVGKSRHYKDQCLTNGNFSWQTVGTKDESKKLIAGR